MADHMPDVWGADQLLAFSGVDGPTDWSKPFVLSTGAAPGSLQVRLPVSLSVAFAAANGIEWEMILGDVLRGRSAAGSFHAAFVDDHTLLGEAPSGGVLVVDGKPAAASPRVVAESGDARLYAVQRGCHWALMARFGQDAPDSLPATRLDDAMAARAAWTVERVMPPGLPPAQVRLLRKAMSVMKVNVHAAQGGIRRRWSTPDRWPHQHMWLWDSAFHAVGMSYVDPVLAQDELLAMLEQVGDDGMLAHTIHPDGERSRITQPPILAWAVLQVLDRGGSLDWARECLTPLRRYLDWDREHRDRNGNGIPEWFIEGNPLCRCGESGLDNSSVYDRAVLLDAPDFGAFLSNDHACLAQIATRLDEPALAGRAADAAAQVAGAVEDLLWSDDLELYCHRTFEGDHVPVKAISGFMPLFAGIPSRVRAGRLVAHLSNPATFGAPAPVPSESLDSGTYCKDMWRGPSWMNLSYLVLLGLRRYGFTSEARMLKERMLSTVANWYEAEGCLFEYYDSLAVTSPRDLDRKQRLISGRGIAPIADYHWTAAVTAALLLEQEDTGAAV